MSKKVSISAFLLIAILVVINFLSSEFSFRADFTEGRVYSLSDATQDILDDLEDPITVKAYFSQDLPAQLASVKQSFQEMLLEYATRSDGKVVYEFWNPNSTEELEKEALEKGIQPKIFDQRDKDQIKQQKGYMGAIISLGEKEEVIPFVGSDEAMEFTLSTAIKKLSVNEKPAIGFLQGHGEAPIDQLIEAGAQLEILYTLTPVAISDSTPIPAGMKTLAIIKPTDSIPTAHLEQMEAFLAQGGRLMIAMNRVDGNLQYGAGTPINTGLEAWLAAKGIEVEDNLVLDAQCAAVTMQQQTGFGIIQQQVSFPFLPVASSFAQHPVSSGLESVVFQFVSTIKYTGDTTKRFVPLVFSSAKSNTQKAPVHFDFQREWNENDFPGQHFAMAAAIEGKLAGNAQTKMVVVADGDFPVNGPREQARRLSPDNVNLLVNSIDWLSDDTGLISLRTKGSSFRPINQLEDTTKTILKYGNFLLPMLLAIGYGVYRMQRNRMKQLKRKAENFDA